MKTPKIELFEYCVFKLIEWSVQHKNGFSWGNFANGNNDFSKLKLIKLHFFLCTANISLLEIFDNFYAMPYGHVESNVYDALNNGQIERFQISVDGLKIISLLKI